jgi:hypothetical protein
MDGWIGVDLDGTLAHYDGWISAAHIGKPIEPMVARVKAWVAGGYEVRIMTARAYCPPDDPVRNSETQVALDAIASWCIDVFGYMLPITCTKDYGMIALYDDRCVQVEMNTGRLVGKEA